MKYNEKLLSHLKKRGRERVKNDSNRAGGVNRTDSFRCFQRTAPYATAATHTFGNSAIITPPYFIDENVGAQGGAKAPNPKATAGGLPRRVRPEDAQRYAESRENTVSTEQTCQRRDGRPEKKPKTESLA